MDDVTADLPRDTAIAWHRDQIERIERGRRFEGFSGEALRIVDFYYPERGVRYLEAWMAITRALIAADEWRSVNR